MRRRLVIGVALFMLAGSGLHLTRLPDVLKLATNVAAFASFLATFLLPFVVVDDATLAPALYASAWIMMSSFAVLCIVPLWETWVGRPGKGFDAIPRRRTTGTAGD